MESMLRHVKSYITRLSESIPKKVIKLEDIKIFPTGYKENNDFPEISAMKPYEWGSPWGGGIDSHAWFYIPVDVPEDMQGDGTLELCLHTDRGGWDADNPQFLCFVDGVMRQAFDLRVHRPQDRTFLHHALSENGERRRPPAVLRRDRAAQRA